MVGQSRAQNPLYNLVVIGASAGGIEAIIHLVTTIPPYFPAPIVIAQHLDPTRPSHLGAILMRRSHLPVKIIADGPPQPLTPGTIYVVPANRNVEITDPDVSLQPYDGRRPKPSIDRLLETAARAYGERLLAVILTGSGSDGSIGARVVKAAGGTVVIENPATASFPSMPASLAPSTVDIVADLAQIGPLLSDLVTGGVAPVSAEAEDSVASLLQRVHAHSGLDFTKYKRATILRCLQRRLVATGAVSLPAYLNYLDAHPEEYARLSASFFINVTSFFRDRQLFNYLKERIVPELLARAKSRGQHRVRVWSAGCATGEEAYSIAILLCEALGDEADRDDLSARIFATDADDEAITFARRGVYAPSALKGLPNEYKQRFFREVKGGFVVTEEVRRLVTFGEHDLGQQAPFPQIDLVLCRNVLIYFTPELQRRALQLFAFALRDGGYLVLGQAETAASLDAYFARIEPRLSVYRRQGGRILVPPLRPRGILEFVPPARDITSEAGRDSENDETVSPEPSSQPPER